MPIPRHARHRPRSALVVALLLFALVLTGLLAYQAQDSARSHRAAAENALRDYAAFAAWEYANRLTKELDQEVIQPALYYLLAADDTVDFPAAKLLEKGQDKAEHLGLAIPSHFALDLRTRRIHTAGRPLDPQVRRWIESNLPGDFVRSDSCTWEYRAALPTIAGEPRAVVFTVKGPPGGPPHTAFGFVADARAFAPRFDAGFRGASLLPRALSAGVPNDSLLGLRVATLEGAELFASEPLLDPALSVRDTLDGAFRNFTVDVAMRPQAAELLVIGGLPRSRLPLLLLLLLLTTGMIAAAILQLRREYHLARIRSQFVSNVSHELRTPLAQIRMFAETLLLGRVRSEEERHRSLEIIDQEARRLSHLVENVLRFSRAERNMTRVQRREIAVASLVEEVAEGFAPLAAAGDAHVEVDVDAALVVNADAEALRQVLLNFLDNALKYGPRGQTVRVAASLRDGKLALTVDDEGTGVPARERERIWNPYSRLDRERTSGIAGTGIGLAVVREIALLHGGTSRVAEAPGGGARFVLELPGARRTAPPAPRPAPEPTQPARREKEVEPV